MQLEMAKSKVPQKRRNKKEQALTFLDVTIRTKFKDKPQALSVLLELAKILPRCNNREAIDVLELLGECSDVRRES